MYLDNGGFRRGLTLKTKFSNEILEFYKNATNFLRVKAEITQLISESMAGFEKEGVVKVVYTTRLDECEWRQVGVFIKLSAYEFEYELAVEKVINMVRFSKYHYEFYENYNNVFYRKTIIKRTV